MSAQECFESLDFFYVESGLHFSFEEIIGGEDERIIILIGNMRQFDIENCITNFYNFAAESLEDMRFVFVHLDGLYVDECGEIPMSVFLSFEEETFESIDEKFPLTFSIECFHCEPSDVEKLSKKLDLTEPLYCSYLNGKPIGTFSKQFPGYEYMVL